MRAAASLPCIASVAHAVHAMSPLLRLARSAAAFLLAISTLPCAFADAGQDARARRFVDDGMAATLAVCELPKACARHKPLRASRELEETGNDSKIDHRRLAFEGLDVELIYAQDIATLPPAAQAKALADPAAVVELTVTTSKWPVDQGLKIGTKRADVERVLGARGEADDACVEYADIATQNSAQLCYAGGRLIAVKWVKWWDG